MNIMHRELYHPRRTIGRSHRNTDPFWRFLDSPWAEAKSVAEWVPAVDIKEEEARFVILADLPGLDAADLDITMTDGVLSLEGKREIRSQEDQQGFRRTERKSGRFKRSFSLPETADPSGIAADYQNGVLEITIPKQQPAQPRRIEVKVS